MSRGSRYQQVAILKEEPGTVQEMKGRFSQSMDCRKEDNKLIAQTKLEQRAESLHIA